MTISADSALGLAIDSDSGSTPLGDPLRPARVAMQSHTASFELVLSFTMAPSFKGPSKSNYSQKCVDQSVVVLKNTWFDGMKNKNKI